MDRKLRANNGRFRGEREHCRDAIDAGNPLQYDNFPLVGALIALARWIP